MASAWIEHVKKFAAEHKIKFGEALGDKRCKATYKSLQTSTPNKGPMSFVPVDAVKAKKSKSSKKSSKKSKSKKSKSKKSKSKRSKSKK
jgi:hypothetical protein